MPDSCPRFIIQASNGHGTQYLRLSLVDDPAEATAMRSFTRRFRSLI